MKAVKAAAKAVKSPHAETVRKAVAALMLEVPEPKLTWMNKSRQWGVRVKPGKKGLTLGSLNVGIYGEIPMDWPDQTRNPRGAIGRKGMPPVGYMLRSKSQVWADSAADLYEEAIQRRWAPATDVPWNTVKPLPDDLERAVCQVNTELSQYANVEIEVISAWQHQMVYGYHEVKQYLATAGFDAARHYEVFRKRALINGGGRSRGTRSSQSHDSGKSRGWTEAVVYLVLVRGLLTQTILRYLERYASNEAESFIYRNVLQDKARLMTYGLDHLKFAIAHNEDQKQIVATLLAIGDGLFIRDFNDPVLREALAIIFGAASMELEEQGWTCTTT